MTHGGLVSIIVPCYKSGAFVRGALDSIGRQIHANWEVLAVEDGGPDDGTARAVREFAKNFPGHRVELLQHETNRGLASARNTAMKAARGDFFGTLRSTRSSISTSTHVRWTEPKMDSPLYLYPGLESACSATRHTDPRSRSG